MNESKNISPPKEKKIDGVRKNFGGTFNKLPLGSTQTKNEQKSKALVILRGITTSQVNQALRAENPYPARVFFREGDKNCAECNNFYEEKKCNACQIPVFFRKKEGEKWIRPKIKTGSYLEVKGFFDNPKNGSSRKSFTALSYQLLNQEQAKVETQGISLSKTNNCFLLNNKNHAR